MRNRRDLEEREVGGNWEGRETIIYIVRENNSSFIKGEESKKKEANYSGY